MSLDNAQKSKLVTDVLCLCIQHSRAAEQLPEPRRRTVVEENVGRFLGPTALDLNGLWATLLREPGVTERSLAAPFAVLEDLQGVLGVPMAALQRLQALTPAQRQALITECTVKRNEVERLVRQARIEAQLAGARRATGAQEAYAGNAASQSQLQPSLAPLTAASAVPLAGSSPAPKVTASLGLVGAPGAQGAAAAIVPPVPAGAVPIPAPASASRPAGPAPSPELLALGLTLADICMRLGPQDAEAMLRRLADLIRDNGLQLASAAAALPAPQAWPGGLAAAPAPMVLPLGGGPLGGAPLAGAPLGEPLGGAAAPLGGFSPGTDEEQAKEARARAARALLEQASGGASAEAALSPPKAQPKAPSTQKVPTARAAAERDNKSERLKLAAAAVGMVVALGALGYTLFVDDAGPLDVSGVTALQLANGTRLKDSASATITDSRWAKMKPEEKKQAASKVFQELRSKGIHNLSLVNSERVPEVTVSDKDPNAPGGLSVSMMGAAPAGSPSAAAGPAGGAAAAQGPGGPASPSPSPPSMAPSMAPGPPP